MRLVAFAQTLGSREGIEVNFLLSSIEYVSIPQAKAVVLSCVVPLP